MDAWPTTRRARWLLRRQKYLRRSLKWRSRKYKWTHSGTPDNPGKRIDVQPFPHTPGHQAPQAITLKHWHASPDPVFPVTFIVTAEGHFHPPFVTITNGWYAVMRAHQIHQNSAYVGYDKAAVIRRPVHLLTRKKTALQRRITGCNFHFWRNGFFPPGDVLGRNLYDPWGGTTYPTTPGGWPDPLGY